MYRKQPIIPPFTGWDNSAPSLALPNNSFKSITGWLLNKGRLIPFPQLATAFTLPVGKQLWGARTFADLNTSLHTLLLGQDTAWFLKSDGSLDQIGTWNATPTPYAMQTFLGKTYFSNGGTDPLQYSDGSASISTAGDAFGSCIVLGKLASRVIMANTTEKGFNFPMRLRWSAVNNANEWDSTVDYTAGATDISDVEDFITGWATINNTGFVFRPGGITVLSPTSIGGAPFFIENFSEGPTGIGNAYTYSLAQYGQTVGFVSSEDVYTFSGQALQAIGGKAKKSILMDVANASSFVVGEMLGKIAQGVDYLAYWLACPQSNDTFTSLWVYHFDDQTWVNEQIPGAIRSINYLALT